MAQQGVEVRVVIHEGMWDKGKYQASITVKATGERDVWTGATPPAKTPLAALQAVPDSFKKYLAPGKRGRKPKGYESLRALADGWL